VSLPKKWARSTVGQLFNLVGGGTPSTGQSDYWSGNIPWISSADINEDHSITFRRFITPEAITVSATNVVPAGSVIVVTRVGLGKVAVAEQQLCFSQDNQALLFSEEHFNPRYVLLYMSTAVKAFRQISRGTTIAGVTKKQVEEMVFDVPPRAEQDLMVAEVEKQFTRLDDAVAALKRVQANLKRYRASVLKAACEGRLVPTEAELARKEGRDYEPASELLGRILAERRAKWEADQLAKMVAAGKPPKDTEWKKRYKEPELPDVSNLPDLPEGWMWSSIGYAFEVYVGATPSRAKPEYWNGNIPWVSSGEVAFCRISETSERITEEGLNNSSTDIHPAGTVLLGMIGEGRTRGQVAILDISACNNQNSAAIGVSEAGLPPEYVYFYLWGQYEKTRTLGSGNNQPALNKSRVQEMLLPVPPTAEQIRIGEQLSRMMSLIENLEQNCSSELARVKALRSSILQRAFSGKLVPQDRNDEPASVLLKRIRAERAQQPVKRAAPKPATKREKVIAVQV
jgi:type I restriction enzyme S subunit